MAEPLMCPQCSALLTDAQLKSLIGRYASAQRKTKAGGRNGGRRKVERSWAELNPALDKWVKEQLARGVTEADIRAIAPGPERPFIAEGYRVNKSYRKPTYQDTAKAENEGLEPIRETVLVPLEDEL